MLPRRIFARHGRLSRCSPGRLVSCFALLLLPAAAQAQFDFAFDPDQQVWSLSNGRILAQFQYTEARTFEFRGIRDLATGDVWDAPAGIQVSPIRLSVGGVSFGAGTTYRLVRHQTAAIDRDGYRQTIVLEDSRRLGRFTVELDMHKDQPVLRHAVRFRNLGQDGVAVQAADMLPWAFSDGGEAYRTFHVNQWVRSGKQGNFEPLAGLLEPDGAPIELSTGAHGQHCAWLALRGAANRGLFAGWEFNGRAAASVRHDGAQGVVQFSAGILDLNRPIAPSQTFQVPAAFIGLYHGSWDEAGYRTQRFAEAALAKPLPDRNFPYVIWNSFGYDTRIDEATMRREAELAARIGAEVFVLDLGWSKGIGDWYEDREKFPNGLRALSDYVHALGMKFGLHFALAEASPRSPVMREHPDWAASDSYGYFNSYSLCLSNRPTREWIIQEALRIIDDYNVDWMVQDGENMVKRCTKISHSHDPADSNYSNAVAGIDAVIEEIGWRRPDVLWENCEDGGNMMTYRMVARYVTSIAPDATDALTTRQGIYGATYPFPPRYTDRYMGGDRLTRYVTRSHMFGGPWIFMNRLAELNAGELELAASEVAVYKSLRGRMRDGKVFHLTPRPEDWRIDAIESYHEATDSAVAFVYRPGARETEWRLHPRGLRPEGRYHVRFQDDSRTLSARGADLMNRGVTVALPTEYSAEIVYIEPAREDGPAPPPAP